jgi:phosphohistidine phosphatase
MIETESIQLTQTETAMKRELMIMRHAKSDWPEGILDYNRPLKKRGRKAAAAMGEWLSQQGLVPDWIISSQADRARETTEKVLKALHLKRHKHLLFDDRLYESNIETLKEVLTECPSYSKRVLIVGHNPSLDDLLMDLVGNHEFHKDSEGKILGTANIARLSMPDDWSRLSSGCAELIEIMRPRDLADSTEENEASFDDSLTTEEITPLSEEQSNVEQSSTEDTSLLQQIKSWLIGH